MDQFDEATSGWDLDWRQLDTGRLEASLLRMASTSATYERVSFNRRFAQRGGSPSGMLTVGLIETAVGGIAWCRKDVSAEDLLVFSPEGDNHCVSRPGFKGHIVSYSEEHLERIARDLEVPLNLGPIRRGGVALQIGAVRTEDLRCHLRQLDRDSTSHSEDAADERIRNELENEIAGRLVLALAGDPPVRLSRIDGFRISAARKARDFIDAHAVEPPTIQDVCREADVSWRTLNYAFHELFGVTPKRYLQATRLDGVRRDLHRTGPKVKISDIANRWGFWHMEQFAADYRRQFGELPSETLARAHQPRSTT